MSDTPKILKVRILQSTTDVMADMPKGQSKRTQYDFIYKRLNPIAQDEYASLNIEQAVKKQVAKQDKKTSKNERQILWLHAR